MAKLGTIVLTGASGTEYRFDVCPWGEDFEPLAAVYAVTRRFKRRDSYSHEVLHVGYTSDLPERFEDHHKPDCFKQKRANCICIHREDDESARLRIEEDLVEKYKPPCNERDASALGW